MSDAQQPIPLSPAAIAMGLRFDDAIELRRELPDFRMFQPLMQELGAIISANFSLISPKDFVLCLYAIAKFGELDIARSAREKLVAAAITEGRPS